MILPPIHAYNISQPITPLTISQNPSHDWRGTISDQYVILMLWHVLSLSSARNWYLNMGLWSLPTRRKFWNKQIFAKQYTLVRANLVVTTLYHLLELRLCLPTPEFAHQTWWRHLRIVYEWKWVRKWLFLWPSLSVYESDLIVFVHGRSV